MFTFPEDLGKTAMPFWRSTNVNVCLSWSSLGLDMVGVCGFLAEAFFQALFNKATFQQYFKKTRQAEQWDLHRKITWRMDVFKSVVYVGITKQDQDMDKSRCDDSYLSWILNPSPQMHWREFLHICVFIHAAHSRRVSARRLLACLRTGRAETRQSHPGSQPEAPGSWKDPTLTL